MEEEVPILKRTLVVTGWLLGASAAWVALLSLVGLALTGRVFTSLDTKGQSSDTVQGAPSGEGSNPTTRSSAHPTSARAPRPNG